MPILPKHFWAPIVAEARKAGDIAAQQETLFAPVATGEPTAGGFMFRKWEHGAFFENVADPNYYQKGSTVTEYANGAYQVTNAKLGTGAT
jgi:hypothetical protein